MNLLQKINYSTLIVYLNKTTISRNFLISLGLLISTNIIILIFSLRAEPRLMSLNLKNIPLSIAKLEGKDVPVPYPIKKILNPDLLIHRRYFASENQFIEIYILYYSTKKGGRTGHNPYACLLGAGWKIIKRSFVRLPCTNAKVNMIIAKKGLQLLLMFHWYQVKDKVFSSGIEQNIYRFFSKIFYNKNDGAFVEIASPINANNITETTKIMIKFADNLSQLIAEFWPKEGHIKNSHYVR